VHRRASLAIASNDLIEGLPRKDRLRLMCVCEHVELVQADVLCQPGQPTRHVYFPTDGCISLMTLTEGSPGLEVGMIGRDGMLGALLALDEVSAPLRALVPRAGTAWRIGTRAFHGELAGSAALRRIWNRYPYALIAQLATSAGCLRFHSIGQRLARRLLMSQDCACADTLAMTHELLASMLGVRRESITQAAIDLQRHGLIQYHRGQLTVLDRSGLEAAACGCYAACREACARLTR
jgi:CRP-like cAMP-binding protein